MFTRWQQLLGNFRRCICRNSVLQKVLMRFGFLFQRTFLLKILETSLQKGRNSTPPIICNRCHADATFLWSLGLLSRQPCQLLSSAKHSFGPRQPFSFTGGMCRSCRDRPLDPWGGGHAFLSENKQFFHEKGRKLFFSDSAKSKLFLR